MWTERSKIISDFNEAILYIDSQYGFHDFRLGNFKTSDSKIVFMIEEDAKEKAHIWDFSFFNTSELKMDIDLVLHSYIAEIEIIDRFVKIGLNNGYIFFNAEEISLGIPKF